MLRIEHVELRTDVPLASTQAMAVVRRVAGAIDEAWRPRLRQHLSIAHLAIDADTAQLAQPDFAQRVARATVAKLRTARERG